MVCEHCGSVVPEGAVVCPQCGFQVSAVQRYKGQAARRQGRPEKQKNDHAGSVMPPSEGPVAQAFSGRGRRGSDENIIPPKPLTEKQESVRKMSQGRRAKGRGMRKKLMINWAMLFTVLLVLIVLAMIGAYSYLRFTDPGQLIMARMGRDANANALWAYGQELLDQGYVDRSVATFEKAYAMEPERDDLYDRLVQLADAYEAAGRAGDAERIYTKLYTEIAPEDPFVYRQMVRLLEAQGRNMELASFLNLAYEKTKDASFRRQREELIPSSPIADQEAGVRKYEQDVQLISAEDYEIYYIMGDEGILPEDGELYTQPIHLDEGTHVIRAVAVSSDLVSDEMRVQYTINLPRPSAPYASLQPGVYERRQRIWLKYIPTEDQELLEQKQTKSDQEKAILAKLNDITIYYTVDGQTPNSNSPIYTGDPFYLPAGKSLVKAVAVNGYGKVSNVMERDYQVKIAFKHYFNDSDHFSDFTILTTTRDDFVRRFGTPRQETEIVEETINSDCVKLTYSWGEARFYMTEKGYILYAVETSEAGMVGPRKTKIGMSETEVTELYRDMGQARNQDGSRSIYYDSGDKKFAMMYHLSAFSDRIDYIYYRTDNGVVTLSYYLENSRVNKMSIRCDFY